MAWLVRRDRVGVRGHTFLVVPCDGRDFGLRLGGWGSMRALVAALRILGVLGLDETELSLVSLDGFLGVIEDVGLRQSLCKTKGTNLYDFVAGVKGDRQGVIVGRDTGRDKTKVEKDSGALVEDAPDIFDVKGVGLVRMAGLHVIRDVIDPDEWTTGSTAGWLGFVLLEGQFGILLITVGAEEDMQVGIVIGDDVLEEVVGGFVNPGM